MSESRSVTIFSANYLPNIGGVERFTEGLAFALAEAGVRVTIVTNNTFGLEAQENLAHGVDIVRLPCHPLINGRMPLPKWTAEVKGLLDGLARIPCDGVLINTRFYIHTLLGLSYAKKMGLTPIVLDHGSAYLTFGNPVLDVFVRMYEHLITAIVKHSKPLFYGISEKSVEWLGTFGIEAEGVISNSIDAARYRAQASGRHFGSELGIEDERLLLAFTGRLIPEKGIDVLVEMMRCLEGEPVDLVVAGDGPLRSRIEESCLDHVHLVGRLDQPDIAALLQEADLFCLPTRSEGFSTSLLESAACGTPFLVTDVGGARELAPDESYGFVVDSADSKLFVSVVKDILHGSINLSQMGERCRLRAEEVCSWSSVACSLLRAFDISN